MVILVIGKNNSVSFTGFKGWWYVDLKKPTKIMEIIIYNRTDCCQDRINDSIITIGNKNVDDVVKTIYYGKNKKIKKFVFEDVVIKNTSDLTSISHTEKHSDKSSFHTPTIHSEQHSDKSSFHTPTTHSEHTHDDQEYTEISIFSPDVHSHEHTDNEHSKTENNDKKEDIDEKHIDEKHIDEKHIDIKNIDKKEDIDEKHIDEKHIDKKHIDKKDSKKEDIETETSEEINKKICKTSQKIKFPSKGNSNFEDVIDLKNIKYGSKTNKLKCFKACQDDPKCMQAIYNKENQECYPLSKMNIDGKNDKKYETLRCMKKSEGNLLEKYKKYKINKKNKLDTNIIDTPLIPEEILLNKNIEDLEKRELLEKQKELNMKLEKIKNLENKIEDTIEENRSKINKLSNDEKI